MIKMKMAAFAGAGLLGALVIAATLAAGAQGEVSSYGETRELTGQGLVDALGLQALSYEKSVYELDGKACTDSRGWIVDAGDGVAYCTTDATKDKVEGWDIAMRILGERPRASDLEAMRLTLAAEEADRHGDDEGASELRSEALDIKAQMATT